MAQTSGFDRLARPYYLLERLTFGSALQRCRTRLLPRMVTARHALVLGDGDGRFTAALLAANSQVRVVAVDSSPAMLDLLTKRVERLGAATRLTTHLADVLDFLAVPCTDKAPQGFDLVATHFFLDCLTPEELRSLARAVQPALAPDALWVVSEFATPTAWTRAVVASLYLAFRLLAGLRVQRLSPFAAILADAGFVLADQETTLHGLLSSTAWTFSQPHSP